MADYADLDVLLAVFDISVGLRKEGFDNVLERTRRRDQIWVGRYPGAGKQAAVPEFGFHEATTAIDGLGGRITDKLRRELEIDPARELEFIALASIIEQLFPGAWTPARTYPFPIAYGTPPFAQYLISRLDLPIEGRGSADLLLARGLVTLELGRIGLGSVKARRTKLFVNLQALANLVTILAGAPVAFQSASWVATEALPKIWEVTHEYLAYLNELDVPGARIATEDHGPPPDALVDAVLQGPPERRRRRRQL